MDDRTTRHLTHHLGEGERAERAGEDVEIWRHSRPEFVSFVTRGLREQPVTALYPQELVCSVQHEQDGAAAFLVRTTLELILGAGTGVINNQLIRNDKGILLERTRITGVLVTAHPYLPDDFDVVFDDAGQVVTDLMTLVPLTDVEVTRADVDGVDALIDILEITDPPLLDVTRSTP